MQDEGNKSESSKQSQRKHRGQQGFMTRIQQNCLAWRCLLQRFKPRTLTRHMQARTGWPKTSFRPADDQSFAVSEDLRSPLTGRMDLLLYSASTSLSHSVGAGIKVLWNPLPAEGGQPSCQLAARESIGFNLLLCNCVCAVVSYIDV